MAGQSLDQTFRVGELVTRVSRAIAAAFPAEVWVRGEVHGLKRPNANGHVYFELCERNNRRGPATTLPVALFRTERLRIEKSLTDWPDFEPADGLEVRVRGRVQHGYGKVSLVVSALDPVHTLGKLAADRQRVLRALAADGLLDRQGRLPFPAMPLDVGLVTSAGSAAYEDVLAELEGSGIGFRVLVADARVQGNGAELSMVRAFHGLRRHDCDVVLLVRGGGSRTDLVAFDGERLARVVAGSTVPVLTGVGHEIDECVADRVAHASFKTPTACAAAVVEQVRTSATEAEQMWSDVSQLAMSRLDDAATRLVGAGHRLSPTRLDAALGRAGADLDRTAIRLRRAAFAGLDRRRDRLDLHAARTDAVDPARALERGWSLTRRTDGRLVRHASDVAVGDEIVTVLVDGTVRSIVQPEHP
jgi:exodeoxyribonuclease VII large subunit